MSSNHPEPVRVTTVRIYGSPREGEEREDKGRRRRDGERERR